MKSDTRESSCKGIPSISSNGDGESRGSPSRSQNSEGEGLVPRYGVDEPSRACVVSEVDESMWDMKTVPGG
jgi:hypothetical protein